MHRNVSDLYDFTIGATDTDIGLVEEFYFDATDWLVRFIAVNTGGWLNARRVLIPPFSIDHIDWTGRFIETPLTRQEIRNSPSRDGEERPLLGSRALSGFAIAACVATGTLATSMTSLSTTQAGRFAMWRSTREWWPGKKVLLLPHRIQ